MIHRRERVPSPPPAAGGPIRRALPALALAATLGALTALFVQYGETVGRSCSPASPDDARALVAGVVLIAATAGLAGVLFVFATPALARRRAAAPQPVPGD